jgi:hypothetical protein
MQTARVFYMDADKSVVMTRDIEFDTKVDLVHWIEPDLDCFWAIEAWQGDNCVLCLKAHGSIEPSCGKPAPPAGPKCCC